MRAGLWLVLLGWVGGASNSTAFAVSPMASAAGASPRARQLRAGDSAACRELLRSRAAESGAAAQLLWKAAAHGGQLLEDEEWYVLDAEWGRSRAPAVLAMQATAARVNCCLYASDEEHAKALLTALHREGKIPWSRPVMFASLADPLLPHVSQLAQQAGATKEFEEPCYFYFAVAGSGDAGAGDACKCDAALRTRPLRLDDANIIDQTWKYRSDTVYAYSHARTHARTHAHTHTHTHTHTHCVPHVTAMGAQDLSSRRPPAAHAP